jgi:hypothetical protein
VLTVRAAMSATVTDLATCSSKKPSFIDRKRATPIEVKSSEPRTYRSIPYPRKYEYTTITDKIRGVVYS